MFENFNIITETLVILYNNKFTLQEYEGADTGCP